MGPKLRYPPVPNVVCRSRTLSTAAAGGSTGSDTRTDGAVVTDASAMIEAPRDSVTSASMYVSYDMVALCSATQDKRGCPIVRQFILFALFFLISQIYG